MAEFKVGDRVLAEHHIDGMKVANATGVVAVQDNPDWRGMVGVDWENLPYGCHNLGGILTTKTGRWAYPHDLRLACVQLELDL